MSIFSTQSLAIVLVVAIVAMLTIFRHPTIIILSMRIIANFGMMWSIGGWLLTNFLQAAGREVNARLRQRVAAEIKPTFASHYTNEVSLAGVLSEEAIAVYNKRATGEKFLIKPNEGL